MHFLLLCNHFETDRTNILDIVAGEVKNFSCENNFFFLMNNENISILNKIRNLHIDLLYSKCLVVSPKTKILF
jgi:hypothetical protein